MTPADNALLMELLGPGEQGGAGGGGAALPGLGRWGWDVRGPGGFGHWGSAHGRFGAAFVMSHHPD